MEVGTATSNPLELESLRLASAKLQTYIAGSFGRYCGQPSSFLVQIGTFRAMWMICFFSFIQMISSGIFVFFIQKVQGCA